ncbi:MULTISPECIES: hypothetical protein [Nitrospirillum]|uniref:Uncharacterized protein n=1 Tax=Nitrospirillum amazonense TaxID=28077 RepID=A0A560KHC9_9PROT|nr:MULTISPECIES: hypothetical protein [Nitrospirillum]MEA1674150.1 hypothetical protein [Nitrospirillum sp. BR 11163]TWB82705.1 hypothetical protein FBZ87_101415 [Nitrospirillum amazonense]
MMTKHYGLLLAAGLLGYTSVAFAAGRSEAQRDVEGYAVATCLVAQDQPYLKEQGYGWGETIVQGRGRDPVMLAPVRAAVTAALAKGDMPVARDEGNPQQGKALPVLYCGEIIDKPGVRAAITKVLAKLGNGR